MSNQNPTANSKDQQPQDPLSREQESPEEAVSKEWADPDGEKADKGHPPLPGTATPAHSDPEYAEREHGKRTTM